MANDANKAGSRQVNQREIRFIAAENPHNGVVHP
jgi:hypothetical protein